MVRTRRETTCGDQRSFPAGFPGGTRDEPPTHPPHLLKRQEERRPDARPGVARSPLLELNSASLHWRACRLLLPFAFFSVLPTGSFFLFPPSLLFFSFFSSPSPITSHIILSTLPRQLFSDTPFLVIPRRVTFCVSFAFCFSVFEIPQRYPLLFVIPPTCLSRTTYFNLSTPL
ncbi:hypothetical protein VTN49DRAFT_734 [Thermomyces lanuginosus]|uniref:uncharacterized protein n=1 Tax=Thermomyces lanuginosus TaxID=5541 RepID=UPI00374487B2